MAGWVCPFCGTGNVANHDTHRMYFLTPDGIDNVIYNNLPSRPAYSICIEYYICQDPSCNRTSISYSGYSRLFSTQEKFILPGIGDVNHAPLPDYVPEDIQNDYNEAYAILHLSPKASATLSRRCIQGIIRDFWDIKGKKSLYKEINAIQDKVDDDVWNAIHAVRSLGNIGAHPEQDINTIVDIEPDEAESLIRLIELLVDESYVRREKRTSLLQAIPAINSKKQADRNPE